MLEGGAVTGFAAAVLMTLVTMELLMLGAEGSDAERVTAVVSMIVVAIDLLVIELLMVLERPEGEADIDIDVVNAIGSGEVVAAAVDVLCTAG